jgi:hypothetical protein
LNKKLLIISPYFPPVNAADMQRIRMSLPYFAACGWDTEVVTIDERYADLAKDELLVQSVPFNIKVHKVKAFSKTLTSKIGLGSIAIRSLWHYRKTVNRLLKNNKFDLIYFSTTQFPICILGAYWKKRFGIPYVIDMQDPWHSDYYRDKPKSQQPSKYWFSYRLNKYLEPIAMKHVDGLISVSADYITKLKARYPGIKHIPSEVITFGAFEKDFDIAKKNRDQYKQLLNNDLINIVYIGRGGNDMHHAIMPLLKALKAGMETDALKFSSIRLYFIGTSYAAAGRGKQTIMPLAKHYGVEKNVVEITDRISYFHTLLTLGDADALFIPGSDDPQYTASKIYPYLLTAKPTLAIFNRNSPALEVLKEYGAEHAYHYGDPGIYDKVIRFLNEIAGKEIREIHYNATAIDKYSAKNMTRHQCTLFNKVINGQV